MILENNLEREGFGYARVLIADYHKEYPFEAAKGVQLVWDPWEVGELLSHIHGGDRHDYTEQVARDLFGPLEQLYGQHYEAGMSLWLIHGTTSEIAGVFDRHAQNLMGGSSGDDDTFDYWPNAFEMLMELATDLIRLGHSTSWIIHQVDRVVASAIAINGPVNLWEADDILTAVPTLKNLAKEVA